MQWFLFRKPRHFCLQMHISFRRKPIATEAGTALLTASHRTHILRSTQYPYLQVVLLLLHVAEPVVRRASTILKYEVTLRNTLHNPALEHLEHIYWLHFYVELNVSIK